MQECLQVELVVLADKLHVKGKEEKEPSGTLGLYLGGGVHMVLLLSPKYRLTAWAKW